jgi:hypothetical protein
LAFSLEVFGQEKEFWKHVINKLIKEGQYSSALKFITSAADKI